MKLLDVYVENFMCINQAHLDLSNSNGRVVFFSGDNGQGKSALLEAIMMCFSEYKRSDKFSEYVTIGKEYAKIAISADFYGEKLDLNCIINNKKGKLPVERKLFYKDNEYKNSEAVKVLSELGISRMLELSATLQGTNGIFDMNPGMRLQLLKEIFKMSDFDDLYKRACDSLDIVQEDARQVKDNILNKEGSISSLNNILNTIIIPDKPKENIDDIIKQKADLTSKLNQANELQKNIFSIKEEIIELNNDKNNINNNITINNKVKNDIEVLERNIKVNTSNLSNIDEEINSYNENIINIELSIKTTNDKYNKSQELYNTIKDKQTALKEKANINSNYINFITKKHICPICESKVDESIVAKLSNLDLDLETLNIELNQAKDIFDINEKELNTYKTNLNNLNVKIASLNSNKINYTKQIEDDKNKIEKLKIDYSSYEKDYTNDIAKLDKLISDKTTILEKLQLENKKYDLIQNEINELSIKENNIRDVLNDIESKTKYKLEIENNIKKDQDILSELEKKYHKLNTAIEDYTNVCNIFKNELPKFAAIKSFNLIESTMNSFIQTIFPDLKISIKDYKTGLYFFYTKGNDTEESSCKMASGYEKSVISLAFKVCLCKFFGITLLMLDEADSAATSENSYLTLSSLISFPMFEQLFIVTHKSETAEDLSSNNSIHYIVKNGKFSLSSFN